MTGDKEAIIPIFEKFLTLFQKRTPAVHLVYDVMCQTLTTLMRRFLKSGTLKGKYGSELSTISCEDVQVQLADKDIVMGHI